MSDREYSPVVQPKSDLSFAEVLETIPSTPNKVQYGVWVEDGTDEDPCNYWILFDSIEDAVSDQGDGVEVYRLDAVYAGTFKRSVKMQKIKKKGKRKNAKTTKTIKAK